MSSFICPLCKSNMNIKEKSYVCNNGHCFDIAKEGYVHLLPPNRMKSKEPGDSKEMAASRSKFLESGYYSPLLDRLKDIVLNYSSDGTCILDCGCGEGYYTNSICKHLGEKGKNIKMAAFDISRPSVQHASKRKNGTEYAVASIFDIPVKDDSFDILLNIFSPMCEKEFKRILKDDGILIYVVPGPRHLWQMKEAIYDIPYENTEEDINYEGFAHENIYKVRYNINIPTSEDIMSLFTMTPYYWKTSAKGSEKLMKLKELNTEVSFDIHIYRKERN